MAEETKFADSFLDLSNLPSSMDELLKSSGSTNAFNKGKIVEGTIVAKRPDGALVDIGYKAEGFVPASEFLKFDEANVGDKIDVYLEEIENRNNMPELSLEKANSIKAWNRITTEYGEGHVVKGFMRHRVKGGIMVDVEGFPAFLPGSQLDVGPVRNMEDYIGKEFDVKIIKINQDRRNIVVSRRELLEESLRDQRGKLLAEMKVDELRKGVVKNITDFGAFIDLGGFDGLLHINDMSWGHVTKPKDFVKKGQVVQLRLINIDPETQKINLSLKHMTADPWTTFADKYHVGDVITAPVTKITSFGVFIELEPGIEGLAHISELSWTRKITNPAEVVKIGDIVQAKILGYDLDKKRVSLGLKQLQDNPWDTIAERYPVGTVVKGTVAKVTSSGAFVTLENGIDGFLHMDDVSWTKKLKNMSQFCKEGDELEVQVTRVEPQNRRIRLSVKELGGNPWSNLRRNYPKYSVITGTVSNVTDFGVFVKVPGDIEGLISKYNLVGPDEEYSDKVLENFKVGDPITAMVVEINPQTQKLSLSIKEMIKKNQESEMAKYMADNDEDDDTFSLGDLLKARDEEN